MSPFPNGYVNWLLIALVLITVIVFLFSGILR